MATSNADTNQAVGLKDGYNDWKRDIVSYHEAKKNFQGQAEPYKKVTSGFIKRLEVQYNPITQTFSDP